MKIRELLSDKSKWTQHAYAVTAGLATANAAGEQGAAWCLVGAVMHCYPASEVPATLRRLALAIAPSADAATYFGFSGVVACWNDNSTRTFEQVSQLVNALNV